MHMHDTTTDGYSATEHRASQFGCASTHVHHIQPRSPHPTQIRLLHHHPYRRSENKISQKNGMKYKKKGEKHKNNKMEREEKKRKEDKKEATGCTPN